MCGRYLLISDFEMLALRYNLSGPDFDIKSGEIFPSDNVPVITEEKNKYNIIPMKWDFSIFNGKHIINARSETAETKSVFRTSLYSRRCIIPANSFYEWQKNGQLKIKYRISVKDESIFSLAGIYNIFRDKDAQIFKGFVILTTAPNKIMSEIHNRMPVILKRNDESKWLSSSTSPNELRSLMQPYEDDKLVVKAE